jgi:hypothetical protein
MHLETKTMAFQTSQWLATFSYSLVPVAVPTRCDRCWWWSLTGKYLPAHASCLQPAAEEITGNWMQMHYLACSNILFNSPVNNQLLLVPIDSMIGPGTCRSWHAFFFVSVCIRMQSELQLTNKPSGLEAVVFTVPLSEPPCCCWACKMLSASGLLSASRQDLSTNAHLQWPSSISWLLHLRQQWPAWDVAS